MATWRAITHNEFNRACKLLIYQMSISSNVASYLIQVQDPLSLSLFIDMVMAVHSNLCTKEIGHDLLKILGIDIQKMRPPVFNPIGSSLCSIITTRAW